MPQRSSRVGLFLGCFLCLFCKCAGSHGAAQEASKPLPAQGEMFTRKIKPLLEKNCYACHSHAAGKSKGGLVVDSRAALLEGGDRGPALVPGDADGSLLLQAIQHHKGVPRMPPKDKLADTDVTLLTDWIKSGAHWPGEAAATATRKAGSLTAEDRALWSLQPLKEPIPPACKDPRWNTNPIDRFIHARLQQEGLEPAPPASRLVLLRRLTYDLIGLPPTPEEVAAFEADRSPDAYEKVVDRLLASPRYGERWARHWLDLVRYAESDGFRLDEYRPDAWRYRDYVIKSFNEDKPYDRFVREQIAGDEIAPDDPDVVVATGFLRLGIYEYNQRDVRTQWTDMLNDITDVTADVFLGMGMSCARCHDHKYDPILQKDYYRLQAFFAAVQPRDDVPLATPATRQAYENDLAAWHKAAESLQAQITPLAKKEKDRLAKSAIEKFPRDIQEMLNKKEEERSPLEKQLAALAYRQIDYEFVRFDSSLKDPKNVKDEGKKKLAHFVAELAKLEASKPQPLPAALTVRDIGPASPITLIPQRKSIPVEPGFLTVLSPEAASIDALPGGNSTGRRTALARWLTKPDNPLTTRVVVNRVWQYHFGKGIVPSASDFGTLGEKPSHPELLDWLARRFVADGWSFKKLHRLILTSEAYRQASQNPSSEIALKKDSNNRLLWHMASRRLDAEQVRDAILAVSGKLDLKGAGPSVDPATPRRTIYTKVRRNTREPLLDVFDAPEGFQSTAERNVTTTPVQALLMINSPFMGQQARALAERIRKEQPAGEEAQVKAAYRLAFGRFPTDEEVSTACRFLEEQSQRGSPGDPPNAEARRRALADFCQVLLNANEFLYID